MNANHRFRILTREGRLSEDTYVLPSQQPYAIHAGCVLVVNERSGETLTVHDTRLFPSEAVKSMPTASQTKSVCLKCGWVKGVVEDQVTCPYHGDGPCNMVELARPTATAAGFELRQLTASR